MLQSRNRSTAIENTCICRRFFQEFKKKGCGGEEMWGGLTPASTRSALPLQGKNGMGAGGRCRSKGGCRWEGLCGGPAGTEGGLTEGRAPQGPEGVRRESKR